MFIYLPITIYLLKLRDESGGVYVETDLTMFLILEMDTIHMIVEGVVHFELRLG